MKKFVIIVDAQVDFMEEQGKLYVPGAQDLIEPMNEYLKNLDPNVGVLSTFDTHNLDTYPESPEAKMFPEHCIKGTHGWDSALASINAEHQYTLEKGVFDMWAEDEIQIVDEDGFKSSREFFFSHLKAQDILYIEIMGIASDFCVKWAVEGLLKRGFRVKVIEWLTKGIERDIHQVLKEDWEDEQQVSLG